MPQPKNDALRQKVHQRYKELIVTRHIGDPIPTRQIAADLGIDYQMVCYYLREGRPTKRGRDSRRTYTPGELGSLDIMSNAERRAYAEKTHRSIRSVDAALARWRKAMVEYMREEFVPAPYQDDITQQGFFDFSQPAHLKIMGVLKDSVVKARKVLQQPYGISLRAPNILYHAATKRRYLMTTQEQTKLLTNPVKFLREQAATIKAGWVEGVQDPVADTPGDPVEVSYPVNYNYSRQTIKDRQEYRRAAEQITKYLNGRIFERDTEGHKITSDLIRTLLDALASDAPQETTTQIQENETSAQDAEDAWMNDYKSVNDPNDELTE